MQSKNNKIWILAEGDIFFLPHLLARLAEKKVLAGIIQIQFPSGYSKKIEQIKKIINCFGLSILLSSILFSIFALILNLFTKRIFSLKKVSQLYSLPFFEVRGYQDPKLLQIFEKKVRSSPCFVQVGKRVPSTFTHKYFLLNKHCSLLPDYKGVYPVFWAMLHGEKNQGVTLHQMDEGFDTGTVLAQRKIANRGSFFEIYHRLYDECFFLLMEFMQGKGKIISEQNPMKGRYFSYPGREDRKKFIQKGLKFGVPFRFQPVKKTTP